MFVGRSHAEAHVTPTEVRAYVKKHVGGQSAPAWVWFLGEDGVPDEFPKTASGKIQKVRPLCDILEESARLLTLSLNSSSHSAQFGQLCGCNLGLADSELYLRSRQL